MNVVNARYEDQTMLCITINELPWGDRWDVCGVRKEGRRRRKWGARRRKEKVNGRVVKDHKQPITLVSYSTGRWLVGFVESSDPRNRLDPLPALVAKEGGITLWELFPRDNDTFAPLGRMYPDATIPASIACMRGDERR